MADDVKFRLIAEDDASANIKKVSGGFDSLKDKAQSFGMAGAGVAVGLGAIVKGAVEGAGKMEQLRVAFSTMIGDAGKADQLLKDIAETAKKTPFQLEELQEGSKRLLAYGVETEKLIPTLTMLGDVAAGVGQEKMPQLITAFGQIKAKGKLMGGELLQLTEAGFNLADAMGVSRSELNRLMETGEGVSFEQVEKAFQNVTGEGGRFHNLMENLSKTFLGTVSNIQDTVSQLLVSFGEALLPTFKALADYINNITGAFATMDPSLKEAIAQGVLLGAAIGALVAAFGLLVTFINPVTIAIAAIVAGFILVKTHGEEIDAFFKSFGVDLNAVWISIQEGAKKAFGEIAKILASTWDFINSNIIPKVQQFVSMVQAKIQPLVAWFQDHWEQISNIFEIAWAGIVMVFQMSWAQLQAVLEAAWALFQGVISVGLSVITGDWKGAWEGMKTMFIGLWGALKSFLEATLGAIIGFIKTSWEAVGGSFEDLKSTATKTWSSFWEGLKSIVQTVVGAINAVIESVKRTVDGLISALKNMLNLAGQAGSFMSKGSSGSGVSYGAIRARAKGGPVNAGQTYMVGEEGPEIFTPGRSGAIIPNNKIMGNSGSGTVMNFFFSGTVSSKEVAQEYADEIVRKLQFSSAVV